MRYPLSASEAREYDDWLNSLNPYEMEEPPDDWGEDGENAIERDDEEGGYEHEHCRHAD